MAARVISGECTPSVFQLIQSNLILFISNPFGIYVRMLGRDVDGYIGILWQGFLNGPKGSLKQMRMLVRPRPGDK